MIVIAKEGGRGQQQHAHVIVRPRAAAAAAAVAAAAAAALGFHSESSFLHWVRGCFCGCVL